MTKDELRKEAIMFTAQHEHWEFYRAVAYSGYPHAIDKLNELLTEFAEKMIQENK